VKSITIKGIPEESIALLHKMAKAQKTSVNALLASQVDLLAKLQRGRDRYDEWWDDHVKWVMSQPPSPVSGVELIRLDRDEN